MFIKEKIKKFHKDIFSKLFQNKPQEYIEVFEEDIFNTNYKTVTYMLRVLFPFELFILFLSIAIKDTLSIVLANIILSLLSLIILLGNFYIQREKIQKHKAAAKFIIYITYAIMMLWGVHLMGYSYNNALFAIDMSLVVILLAFRFLTKYQILLAYYFGGLMYLFLFTPYLEGAFDYLPKLATPILLMLTAFILSRLLYNKYIERFILNEKLKNKHENLTEELYHTLEELRRTERSISTDIIKTLVKVLEYYDTYTRGHSSNVADYAVEIAKEMNFSEEQLDEILLCGLVHDIGKILIPVSILNKTTPLTKEEYEVIMQHSQYGCNMLSEAIYLSRIAKIVLHHHEKWDGSGYPLGLKQDEIPIESQILMVADAWDAMTSERIYKKAKSIDEAAQEMLRLSGKQFPPAIVDVFLKRMDKAYNKAV